MSLHKYKQQLLNGLSDDWLIMLDTPLLDKTLKQIKYSQDITPPMNKIFEFAKLTSYDSIKVVIVGQDPYPAKGDAHGLAFSCLDKVPASLKNIFKCLINHKLMDEMPIAGDLTSWASQGVLLINCALTTLENNSNVHMKIWIDYTTNLLKRISDRYPNTIFLLWGNFAQKLSDHINPKCTIMTYSHPSPLSQIKQAFVDCDHFVAVNKLLVTPIDWSVKVVSAVDKKFDMNPRKTVLFTDGSANPNKTCPEAIGGYATVFALGVFQNVVLYGNIENRPHYANNQRAEGGAIYRGMLYLKENIDKWDSCIIVSDSDFWIKMFTNYMPSWISSDIDFKSKKNPDMTVPMWDLFNELTVGHDKQIEFRHVQAHGKSGWGKFHKDSYEKFCYDNNDYVDKMSKYARLNLAPGNHVVSIVEYD